MTEIVADPPATAVIVRVVPESDAVAIVGSDVVAVNVQLQPLGSESVAVAVVVPPGAVSATLAGASVNGTGVGGGGAGVTDGAGVGDGAPDGIA
jgi:hypothetical protein